MMASGQDASKNRHWPKQPGLQQPRPASRRPSNTLCGRYLTVLLVLVSACCLALLRASGWTGAPPLLSSLHRHGHADYLDPDAIRPGASKNEWAQESLPKGDWPRDQYLIGAGKADITGPVVELNMMGYADFGQVGSGLRQRLYSRAFIVGDMREPTGRFVYLVLDIQSGDTAIRYGILRGLRALGPRYSMYGHDNLAVTATHSHSGPGAWLNYLLPQITSKGFDRQSYRAIVEGCILSIRRAHEGLEPGSLAVGSGKILRAGINRSLFAYLANPADERARYNISSEDDGSVETDMTMLKFQRASDGKNIGVLTWFPTHGTSMQANNTLITGDNKGVAADLFEKKVRGGSDETDDFVAGFSQANMGDVSPNVLGAWCDDGSGQRCKFEDSTCGDGRCVHCRARGPGQRYGDHGTSSCFEIGRRQYQGALDIYQGLASEWTMVRGEGVRAFHQFHDMSKFNFTLPDGTPVRTCPAALGYSFGAGTWDEPGAYDLVQHVTTKANSSIIWNVITWALKQPDEKQVECQRPKSILLNVGEVSLPYQWTPNVVDIQTFRAGQFFVVVSPGEVTTMAGRRWKQAVADQGRKTLYEELDGQEPMVVLGGPSNSYTHYITTDEEYCVQRYEGSSTLYGRHTLAAHIDRSIASMPFLRTRGAPSRDGEGSRISPPDNSDRSWSFILGVLFDRPMRGRDFGQILSDVEKGPLTNGKTARATFVGANPRNNLRLEQTYAAVEQRIPGSTDEWKQVRDDSDWGLTFRWRRINRLLGTSEVDIEWEIEEETQPGEYRLRYFGDYKSFGGHITSFEGTSKTFRVD